MQSYYRVFAVSLIFIVGIVGSGSAWANGVWRENAPMTSARAKLGAANVGGVIYVAGGAGISGPRSSFDLYDPVGDLWRPQPPMPEGREQFGMAAIGDKVFISGGLSGNGHQGQLSSDLWLFDTGQGIWIQKSSMPRSRRGHAMAAVGDRLYVIGGAGGEPSKMMAYEVAKDQWEVLPTAPSIPRAKFGVTVSSVTSTVLGCSVAVSVTSAWLTVHIRSPRRLVKPEYSRVIGVASFAHQRYSSEWK